MDVATLFYTHFGIRPHSVVPLTQAGSNRRYFRLSGEDFTVVGVEGNNIQENAAFIYLARHFSDKGLAAPHILATSDDGTSYLQSDLGGLSLYDALAEGRAQGGAFSPDEEKLLERTLRALSHVQVSGAEGLDAERLLPPTVFDRRAVMFDLNYFKYCFLRLVDVPFDEIALEDDFEAFALALTQAKVDAPTFLYRDFQARNVMLVGGAPHFIDFQGGRIGPPHYDVASFLWQASARYSPALRERLVAAYLDELQTLLPIDTARFCEELQAFVLFRQLQVLGAYGLRGLYERKPYFLQSIPFALHNVAELLDAGAAKPYPTLEKILRHLTQQLDLSQLRSYG